ncbi:MAG: response regulator [Flavobacteriales bacterium]|nr:response regulator [Flavobacteriales bacterium]
MEAIAAYRPFRITQEREREADYKIFIVEDSAAAGALLAHYLERLPRCKDQSKPRCEIHTFESGEECLKHLYLHPDIIVLDYFLDEKNESAMDGLAILRRVKKESPSTEVIMMSGQQEVMVVAELFNNGIREYISKEHACHVRVEEAVLRIFEEKRHRKRRQNQMIIGGVLCFIAGLILGGWFV